MVYYNEDGSITSNAAPRTIIGQTAIDAEKDATIARLQAELEDATAALDRIKAEAELAGWKRGRDDAAAHMDNASVNCRKHFTYPPKNAEQRDWQTGALLHANAATAIRALTPLADLLERLGGAE